MMDSAAVIGALGALAQEHRLAAFRLLVQAGDEGMPEGAIAEALGVPHSSLYFHLAQLTRAGLIRQERQRDRKRTRLHSSTNAHLVCRLLLEKKYKNTIIQLNHM